MSCPDRWQSGHSPSTVWILSAHSSQSFVIATVKSYVSIVNFAETAFRPTTSPYLGWRSSCCWPNVSRHINFKFKVWVTRKKKQKLQEPFFNVFKKSLSVNPSYDAAYSVVPGGMSSLEQKNKRLPLPREVAKKRGSQCYEWEVASVEDSHCLVAGVTPPGSQCRGVAGVAFPK